MTLRSRVFLYVSAATAGVCVLTLAIAAVLVRHRLISQESATLARQTEVVAVADRTLGGTLTSGAHVYKIGSGLPAALGAARTRQVLAAVRRARGLDGRITLGAHSYLFAERPTDNGEVILIRRTSLLLGDWRPFLISLVLAGAGGLLMAAFSAWLLARRLTRPIAALAHATAQVAAGEADIEVGVVGSDELAGLARSFNEMAHLLEASRVEQRQFFESVSHEFKTPLTSIRGYAEGLSDGAVDQTQASRVIGAEAGRLERLVGDLLDLARLQRAGFSVSREQIDLNELAARAIERHQPSARALGVSLTREADKADESDEPVDRGSYKAAIHQPDAYALGDRDRVLQAISNLIENALRLTPSGGLVTVLTAPGRIAVRDTGPGLAVDELPHAFERFYLHERYGSEREVGTGLGLAIVHDLAQLMGGQITAENAADEYGGAIFTLRLPRA